MYQVEGYAFETKEQEHTAKHEVEIIGYIRKNTRMDDPDIVLASTFCILQSNQVDTQY